MIRCYPAPARPMWGLATEDTLRLLRAWKAEITPGSSKPTSTGRVVSKPTEPTPTRPPGWSQGRIAITNQAPQAADGWGARSASDPVRRSREVSCAHGPHIGMLFFDRDLDPVCEVHPQKRECLLQLPHRGILRRSVETLVAVMVQSSSPSRYGRLCGKANSPSISCPENTKTS